MNGRTLLSMTQDDFMVRAPEGGDTLHAQLQLWKTAYDSYSQQNSSNNNSGNNQSGSQIIQNCNRPSQYWVNPSPLALNVAEQGELLTSAQDYLNNFNPSNTDTAIGMSCYSNSTYQNASQEAALPGTLLRNNNITHQLRLLESEFYRAQATPKYLPMLLDHPKQYSSCVRWVDRQEGTFKIESSHHLARFWGQRKNRAQMNYDKLSRSLRQYYKKGIIQKPEKSNALFTSFFRHITCN
ncbi:SAM pointed domain-containing Ets transcription factor [Dirofilaria immitis]|nr:SAM pointed domain-containing Ets transcription factor [Dirofilaria immitis]